MYTVYLGLHDKTMIKYGLYSPPTVKMSVSKVVVVNFEREIFKEF